MMCSPGFLSLFCTSSSVATTRWDAGSVGDSEGPALRRALARAGSACLDAKESIGPKGRRGRGGAEGAPPRQRDHAEVVGGSGEERIRQGAPVGLFGRAEQGQGDAREAREAAAAR